MANRKDDHKGPYLRRVVWAVDPSEKPGSPLHSRAKQVIRSFLRRHPDVVIEPVHVLRISQDLGFDFTSKWRNETCMAAEDAMEEFVRSLRITGLATPKVICQDSLSTRGAVDALCDHALESKADLILAQTHGRSGVNRFFLGSFAETLLLRSKVPVMLLNQRGKIGPTFNRILFPTDFGQNANAQFSRVMDLAASWGAKVTLFHSFEGLTQPTVYSSMIGPPAVYSADLVRRWLDQTRRRVKRWVEIARTRGVEMDFVLDERGRRPWVEIVRLAGKINAGMIVMQSHAGPVRATFLGSTTRQVVRHAYCPVWVFKPERRVARVIRRAEEAVTAARAA